MISTAPAKAYDYDNKTNCPNANNTKVYSGMSFQIPATLKLQMCYKRTFTSFSREFIRYRQHPEKHDEILPKKQTA